MAYDLNKLTRLKALQSLANRTKTEIDAVDTKVTALATKVDGLVASGGEPNTIDSITVNGVAQTPVDKVVDITVPTKVSELTNDSSFQTETEVSTAIETAIAGVKTTVFEKKDTIPTVDEAEDGILYLVMNTATSHYDIYAKVGTEVVLLDDTTVDLSNYVEKETGKGLSTNDYTDADKTKLAGIDFATDTEVTEMLEAVFGATEEGA